jgi:threonine-phosphate decarboxylase
MIYGHGNELALYKSKIIADFSSNVICEATPSKLITHLTKEIHCISNYPEPDASSLQMKLATFHQISPDSILVTNGSTEAFYLLAQLFRNKHSLIFTPSFSEYEDACKVCNHHITFVENKNALQHNYKNINVVWLGNPNNPDGKTTSRETIKQFCVNNPHIILIIDEAYADLCAGFESCLPLTETLDNLIVVRSLTKTFAIAGLRLGYLVTNKSLASKIAVLRMPWSVNALAIEAGKYIIDEYATIAPNTNYILENSIHLQTQLGELDFMEVVHSKTNFFLARLLSGTASELKNFLIDNKGVLIRDASNFRGLNNSWIRLAVQKTANNNLLYEGLLEWNKQ